MLRTFLTVFLIFFVVYGIEGFGVSPEILAVRVNGTFKIRCSVSQANGELNFYDGEELVSDPNVKRINDTCIEMTQRFTRPVKKNYTCKQNRHIVGLSDVSVDGPMSPVENFKCRTDDLNTLQCSFKKPQSYIPIKYRLHFSINGGKKHHLQLDQDGQSGYTSEIKVPEFNKNSRETFFNLTLQANNKLSFKLLESFEVKLLESLMPRSVLKLNVMSDLTTHKSALIAFSLPVELKNISGELMFDVKLKLEENEAESWQRIENPRLQLKDGDGLLAIDDLDYANTAYRVKIRMKSIIAPNESEFWSPFDSVLFKTKPKIPNMAPNTCANCFNVMDNGNVVVYWSQVQELYQNADNFEYLVRGWDEMGKLLLNEFLQETSLTLSRKLNAESLSIRIYSSNSVGTSESFSQLLIPLKQLKINKKLLKIRKEIIKHKYQVSWKLLHPLDVESFTVLWCNQRNELHNQCDGFINFRNFPANEKEFILEASNSKQFGIAINQRNQSIVQGFEWADCTASKSNEIGKVQSLWSAAVTENKATIQWKLNCADEPIVAGYNITHCQIDDKDMNKCVEPPESHEVILLDGEEIYQFEISNLKTYKRYNISVALMSHTRLGLQSNPITVRTLEAAPTTPRLLQAVNIERHSIDLTWNRPQEVNGESLSYEFWFNQRTINIYDNNTMNETFAFTLSGLDAYTDYTITVKACTSKCSNPSESLEVRTRIDVPGEMFQPTLETLDGDKVLVTWEVPTVLGGNLDFFQLKLISAAKHESVEEQIYRIDGRSTSCIINNFRCENEKIDFSVRSVNIEIPTATPEKSFHNRTVSCLAFQEPIDKDGEGQFHGQWSQPIIYYCRQSFSMAMTGAIFLFAFSFVVFVYVFIRLYQKYKDMKDIHIVWPKGLDPDSVTSSPSKKGSYDGVKDLDLIKDHVLTDIEEEEEVMEKEKFISPQIVATPETRHGERESTKSEVFLPFICNPKTNEIFYQLPKSLEAKETTKSVPNSPVKPTGYTAFHSDPHVDQNTGYMKMYAPQNSRTESLSASVEGYLDMNGKPAMMPVERPCNGYTLNDIKMFIKGSELHNNGYIGKRASILSDPINKHQTCINSNGYVGLRPK